MYSITPLNNNTHTPLLCQMTRCRGREKGSRKNKGTRLEAQLKGPSNPVRLEEKRNNDSKDAFVVHEMLSRHRPRISALFGLLFGG